MGIFDKPVFIKPLDPKGDVLMFGKGPELELADANNGVARFGGDWRTPSYFFAYLRSARILIEHGVQNGTLDDIALPAFYMQRHAFELLAKRLLSWVYQLAEYRLELQRDCQPVLSKKQRERFDRSHKLSDLLRDLKSSCMRFGFREPPAELEQLAREIEKFEKSDTWARYERSKNEKDGVVLHVQDEVVLPLVDLQRQLEEVSSKVVYGFNGERRYENELYDHWLDALRATGRAG